MGNNSMICGTQFSSFLACVGSTSVHDPPSKPNQTKTQPQTKQKTWQKSFKLLKPLSIWQKVQWRLKLSPKEKKINKNPRNKQTK